MEEHKSFFERQQANINEAEKSILEGIVKLLIISEQNRNDISRLQTQINNLQQTLDKQQSTILDTRIIANNNNLDLETVNQNITNISQRIDMLDMAIKNIKIYKTVSATL